MKFVLLILCLASNAFAKPNVSVSLDTSAYSVISLFKKVESIEGKRTITVKDGDVKINLFGRDETDGDIHYYIHFQVSEQGGKAIITFADDSLFDPDARYGRVTVFDDNATAVTEGSAGESGFIFQVKDFDIRGRKNDRFDNHYLIRVKVKFKASKFQYKISVYYQDAARATSYDKISLEN